MDTINKKWQKLISIGLLLVVLPLFLRNWMVIPNIYADLLMGIGIGMELVAVFKIYREKQEKHLE